MLRAHTLYHLHIFSMFFIAFRLNDLAGMDPRAQGQRFFMRHNWKSAIAHRSLINLIMQY